MADRANRLDIATVYGLRRYLNDVLETGTATEQVVARTALRMIATPAPAALPAVPMEGEASLHDAIMNLPCKFQAAWDAPSPSEWIQGYYNGYLDTRYAAAELAASKQGGAA